MAKNDVSVMTLAPRQAHHVVSSLGGNEVPEGRA